MLDVHFKYKNVIQKENIREGVSVTVENQTSLRYSHFGHRFEEFIRFGKWPFPRNRHGILLDNLGRIRNQWERESAVFLDIFFVEPDRKL